MCIRDSGISYSQLEEVDTALCLQRLAMTPEDGVPLPSNIYPGTATTLKQSNTFKGKVQEKNTVHGLEASVFRFNFLRIVLCQYVKLLNNILAG